MDPSAEVRKLEDRAVLRPADWVAAIYNGILAVVWAWVLTDVWYAPLIFAAHTAAAGMPWLILRSQGHLSPVGRWLREVYPLLWILAWWTELDFLRHLLHTTTFDEPIAALDRAVFGGHLDAVWMPSMSAVWFSEIMHLVYWGYYAVVFIPLVYVAAVGPAERLRDMTFRVTLIYVACFLTYIALPVDGPHFLREHYQGPLTDGFFYNLVWAFQGAGDSQGCSFPSSHVAAAMTMAYVGVLWFPRGVAILLVVAASGVAISIVYTQNHYAIDSIAGIVWALVFQLAVAPAILRWWRSRRGEAEGECAISEPSLQPE